MISRTAEYALRAMVFLAAEPSRARTVREIAAATIVPEGYLSKVMQALSRARLVRSQRGLHGGFTLVDDPATLSILQVVDAVDPLRRIGSCPLGLPSHRTELCPMHGRLDEAIGLVREAFAKSTLAELLRSGGSSRTLCDTPHGRARPGAAERRGRRRTR